MAEKEIVAITGGAGFLAQHLVKELNEKCSHFVKEIRVADKKLYKKILYFEDKIPLTEHVVDCVEEEELDPVLDGVSTVFNLCARRYSFDMYEDREKQWEDSVISAKVLCKLMVKHGVQWLVHVGDAISVVGTDEDAQQPVEQGTLEPPSCGSWILGSHGEAKFRAEEIVRKSNNKQTDTGTFLKTVVIRPTPLYGEGDTVMVPYALRTAKQWKRFQRIGHGDNIMQMTYAGNCAAMLTLAWKKLQEKPEDYGGEVFFCSETEKCENYFEFMKPFVEMTGYKVSSLVIPYEVAYILTWAIEKFFHLLVLFDMYFPHNLPNTNMVRIVGGLNYHFSPKKTDLMMEWKPPYDPEIAKKRTLNWWENNWKTEQL